MTCRTWIGLVVIAALCLAPGCSDSSSDGGRGKDKPPNGATPNGATTIDPQVKAKVDAIVKEAEGGFEDGKPVWIAAERIERDLGADAAPYLIELTSHADRTTRAVAIDALGRLRDARGAAALIAVLQRDAETANQAAAAKALGDVRDPSATPALLEAVQDASRDARVRLNAADAIGSIKSPEAVEPLTKLTGEESMGVRRAVIRTLGEIGGAPALAHLLTLLQGDDMETSMMAGDALVRLGDGSAVATMRAVAERHKAEGKTSWQQITGYADRLERKAKTAPAPTPAPTPTPTPAPATTPAPAPISPDGSSTPGGPLGNLTPSGD